MPIRAAEAKVAMVWQKAYCDPVRIHSAAFGSFTA